MREKEGFRDQYDDLVKRFPGKVAIDIKACCEMLGCDRQTILKDKTFPVKKVSGKYIIPLVGLARWMC